MDKCPPRVNEDGRREDFESFATIKICINKTFGKNTFNRCGHLSTKTQMHVEVEQLYSGFIDMDICPQEI